MLKTRFGGDAKRAEVSLAFLRQVRDHVLEGARLGPSDVVLDVGCGDGLIAFGALDRLGPEGQVVFSDVSAPLLDRCREIAAETGVSDRCRFLQTAAERLAAIPDASVDVVAMRSVLIYVSDKNSAFASFHRVLRSGGRLSLFEPINRYEIAGLPSSSSWYTVPGVEDLGARLRDFYDRLQPRETDPMFGFDEKDLVRLAADAGFVDARLELRAELRTSPPASWETTGNAPPNPRVPSLRDAMAEVFTAEERQRYEATLRPLVEAGGRQVLGAVAFLTATKR